MKKCTHDYMRLEPRSNNYDVWYEEVCDICGKASGKTTFYFIPGVRRRGLPLSFYPEYSRKDVEGEL